MLFDRFSRRESMTLGSLGAAALLAPRSVAGQARQGPVDRRVRHKSVKVDGLRLFYREAGHPEAPVLLLLHGFPSSSHMFRNLMPMLADRFRLVAPDYPGFGFSDFPARDEYSYSFDSFASLVAGFTDALGLRKYGLYVQDYGAPIGFRLGLKRPDAVRFLVVQNGNAYDEGLSAGWDPLKAYWRDPSDTNRERLKGWLSEGGTRLQYSAGLTDTQMELLGPELWTLDWALLQRPGNLDLQLDLFGDYATNVALYPEIQAWLRERQPPALVAWGKADPFFTEAGARAYLRDLPRAELRFFDGSHFLLETHAQDVARAIRQFAERNLL